MYQCRTGACDKGELRIVGRNILDRSRKVQYLYYVITPLNVYIHPWMYMLVHTCTNIMYGCTLGIREVQCNIKKSCIHCNLKKQPLPKCMENPPLLLNSFSDIQTKLHSPISLSGFPTFGCIFVNILIQYQYAAAKKPTHCLLTIGLLRISRITSIHSMCQQHSAVGAQNR